MFQYAENEALITEVHILGFTAISGPRRARDNGRTG